MKNMKKAQGGTKVDKVAVKKTKVNPNIPTAKQQKNLKDASQMKNMRPVFKHGGAVNYSSAGKATGYTGEGTYSPKPKNVGKRKKMTIQGDLKFKGGGSMKRCKGGC